jgi:hypothetical protein
MDKSKSSAPARTPEDPAPRLPDHELIRRDAAAHPERCYREHVEASRRILGPLYLQDLRRIQERETDDSE